MQTDDLIRVTHKRFVGEFLALVTGFHQDGKPKVVLIHYEALGCAEVPKKNEYEVVV